MDRTNSLFERGDCTYEETATPYSNYAANLHEVRYQNEKEAKIFLKRGILRKF